MVDYNNPPSNVSAAFTQAYDFYSRIANDSDPTYFGKDIKIYQSDKLLNQDQVEKLFKPINEMNRIINQFSQSFIGNIKNYDPLIIAQMIKNRLSEREWNYLIRKCIYNSYEETPFNLINSDLTNSLIQLVSNSDITDIVNYNYDDTFYHILKNHKLHFNNIYSKISCKNKRCKIYYPHGYLPLNGGVTTNLILTEEDYQDESFHFDTWSNILQRNIFSCTSGIFIGVSLVDPALRSLLKTCNSVSKYIHYAFLPIINSDESQIMIDSLFDADLYRLGVKVIRFPLNNNDDCFSNLPNTINFLN